ncbi:MAG: signal peptide peptidase SppA [Bacteroidia bacterium]|nr:signal peptide peptidase SppA [Bacteroidia bacterium]
MKQFIKIFFASMLGFIFGLIVLFFLLVFILSAMVSSIGNEEVKIADGSILHINLDYPIRERTSKNPFDSFSFNTFETSLHPGLNDILKSIRHAAKDEKVKGIYLDITSFQGGLASVNEIRDALLDFKTSGKFIYAFADTYTQGAYYLASSADKIYLNPEGQVVLNGLATEMMFFKGTLEKLEIEPQVIRHGKYKSAVEPFLLEKMSDENRAQISAFVDPIWQHLSSEICRSRKIERESFKLLVDSFKVRTAKDALTLKLVDKLAYYDEFMADVNRKIGNKENEKLPLVSIGRYSKAPAPKTEGEKFSMQKIAIVYAVGAIGNGDGNEESIGSDRLAAAIRKARNDDKVKAIVMRVNSPGGDALASEEIWREVTLARKEKPFVVSMGDLAASGGYYISCAADAIVAQPNTLTGSIGVFGLLFNAEKMLKNKLGITTDVYKTNPYTDMGTITRSLSSQESLILQQEVDRIYDVFTRRVAEGRKLNQAQVDSIGQGRVWSGNNAIQIGLVDTLGGLETAINIAAQKAGIKEYRTIQLPEQKDPFQTILEDFATEAKVRIMQEETGTSYRYLQATKELLKLKGVQALSPFSIGFY